MSYLWKAMKPFLLLPCLTPFSVSIMELLLDFINLPVFSVLGSAIPVYESLKRVP